MHVATAPLSRRHALQAGLLLLPPLLAGCAVSPPVTLSADDRQAVSQIQTYLDGLRRFRARFLQNGADGEATGVIWIDRPGRLRVAYTQPSPRLLLANHGRLLLVDQKTGGTTTMPVARTPLGILLADRISLSGDVTVSGVQRAAQTMQVGLVKTASPSAGRLTLQFSDAPLALIGVVVQDAAGHTNTLELFGLDADPPIDPALFQYQPSPAAPP